MSTPTHETVVFETFRSDAPGHSICQMPISDGNVFNMVEYGAGAYQLDHYCPRKHYGIVLEGAMSWEFENGEWLTVSAGQALVMNGMPHRMHNRGDVPARFLMIDLYNH